MAGVVESKGRGEERKSLKERLMQNVDDLEWIIQQLAEVFVVVKEGRGGEGMGIQNLVSLLTVKESDLQHNLQLAKEYSERKVVIEKLKEELKIRDQYLKKVQTSLKESESLLISAVFQANQKLKAINHASNQKVSPDELIKYAHKISKTNSVAAPLTWQQGDPERPFPTDVEMRKGHLARHNEPQPSESMGQMFPPAAPPQQTPGVPSPHLTSALIGQSRGTPPGYGAAQVQIGARQPSPGYPLMPSQAGLQRGPYHFTPPVSTGFPGQQGSCPPQGRGSPMGPGAVGAPFGSPGAAYGQGQTGSPISQSAMGPMPRLPPPYPGGPVGSPRAAGAWGAGLPRAAGFNQPGVSPQMTGTFQQPHISPRMRTSTPFTNQQIMPPFPHQGRQGTPPMPMMGPQGPSGMGQKGFPPQPAVVNPYMGGPIAATQLRQRRPSSSGTGQRNPTPPTAGGNQVTRPQCPRPGAPLPDVQNLSSDSSSSSSSENNSPS